MMHSHASPHDVAFRIIGLDVLLYQYLLPFLRVGFRGRVLDRLTFHHHQSMNEKRKTFRAVILCGDTFYACIGVLHLLDQLLADANEIHFVHIRNLKYGANVAQVIRRYE